MHKTVVYILCPSRSGSTLLGNLLGGHPAVLHIGEVVAPVRKGKAVRCRVCTRTPCPVWDGALDASYVRAAVTRFGGATEDRLDGGQDGPGELHRRLFERFAGKRCVVDGSKKLDWARYHARSSAHDHRFLFLRRDLRGCFASWKRAAPEAFERTARAVARLAAELGGFERSLPAGTSLRMRYEDLVEDPTREAERVCGWLELPFAREMIDHRRHDHHLIGGNPGPLLQHCLATGRDAERVVAEIVPAQHHWYRALQSPYFLDERWQTDLTAGDLACFEETLGAINSAWGYAGTTGRAG